MTTLAEQEAAWWANHEAVGAAKERLAAAQQELVAAETEWVACCRTSIPRRRPPECGCGEHPGRYAAVKADMEQARADVEAAIDTFKAGA